MKPTSKTLSWAFVIILLAVGIFTGLGVILMHKQPLVLQGQAEATEIRISGIVVKNPLAYELPKREVVIKSGRTLYRFTGSYDGQRALPSKVLRLMDQDNLQKDDDDGNKER